ncbi:hypothetical protein DITRI_Ditri13aG0053300 [Diplodiscus trichospermus]
MKACLVLKPCRELNLCIANPCNQHPLARLRELSSGVLDSLTPEQVMHCNTEDDCKELKLLYLAINLMADFVQHEQYNKMNGCNIAMVFAPKRTQMADPLTVLIHAVQVMNFLKTLILKTGAAQKPVTKTLSEREESAANDRLLQLLSCTDSRTVKMDIPSATINCVVPREQALDAFTSKEPTPAKFLGTATLSRLEYGPEEEL